VPALGNGKSWSGHCDWCLRICFVALGPVVGLVRACLTQGSTELVHALLVNDLIDAMRIFTAAVRSAELATRISISLAITLTARTRCVASSAHPNLAGVDAGLTSELGDHVCQSRSRASLVDSYVWPRDCFISIVHHCSVVGDN
jgi:hypothetical protein